MPKNHMRRGRPSFNRPIFDRGTEELQHKRKMLLEKGEVRDFSLAESLLGVLYAHQMISRSLYEAGCFFGELGYRYEPCLGGSFRSRASLLTRPEVPGRRDGWVSLSDAYDERLTQSWRNSLLVLKKAGPASYKAVCNVVFYDQDLYAKPLLPFFMKELKPLRRGLDSLDTYFKGESKGKKGKLGGWALNSPQSTTSPHSSKEFQSFVPP